MSYDGKCAHCGWPHHPSDGRNCVNCKRPWQDIEALEMEEHEAQARRIVSPVSDAQPYTREELERAAKVIDDLYRDTRSPWIRMNPEAWKRLLATAKQGVEVMATANAAIRALDNYADEVRGDWSDFDGRANRRELHAIVADLRELLRGGEVERGISPAAPAEGQAPTKRPQCERDPICQCEPGHEGACWPERYAAAVERGVREPREVRELLCMSCDREYQVWFATNDLWNRVVRRADGSDEWPFLCPTCFTNIIAVERGIDFTAFEVRIAERGVRETTDTERLDWIEEHGLPDEKVHDGDSLREAIDIARESETARSGQRLHSNSQGEQK